MGLGSRKEEAADQGPRSCGELKPQQRFNAGSLRGFRAKGPEEAGDTDWPWIQTGKGVQAGSEQSKGPPGGGGCGDSGLCRDPERCPRGRWVGLGSQGASQGDVGQAGVPRSVPERSGLKWRSRGMSHGDLGQTGVPRGFPGDSEQRGTRVPRGVRGALTRRGWRMGDGRPRPT